MARPGISYHDIAEAAQSLTAQGHYPTIERIRAVTGTGSSTTIAQHLRTWRAEQETNHLLCQQEKLPDEFIALMKGLWERVLGQAEERLQVIQQDYEQQLVALTTQTQALREDNHHWQQQHQQASEKNNVLVLENTSLLQQVKTLENEALVLNSDHKHALSQLQVKDEQLGELQRQNKQTQANLEHYREAAREQRLLDQQRHEQATAQLEQTIQHLRHELATTQNQKHALQNQHDKMQFAQDLLQNELAKLNQELLEAKHQRLRLTEQYTQTEQYWQNQQADLQKQTAEQQHLCSELQKQLAITTEQLLFIRQEAVVLSEANKNLLQEKLAILQEKGQLEGQLKIMHQFKEKSAVA